VGSHAFLGHTHCSGSWLAIFHLEATTPAEGDELRSGHTRWVAKKWGATFRFIGK
jgi:hypothetical protein